MSLEADLKKFFAEQERSSTSFQATVESVTEPAGSVKITPFDSAGCGCDQAMVVAMNHIESFEPMEGQWHECCGKRLQVVRVSLKADATVRVSDLLSARARQGTGGAYRPNLDCWHQELQCIAHGTPYGLCHAYYEDCLERDSGRARGGSSDPTFTPMIGCRNPRALSACLRSGEDPGYCWNRFCH